MSKLKTTLKNDNLKNNNLNDNKGQIKINEIFPSTNSEKKIINKQNYINFKIKEILGVGKDKDDRFVFSVKFLNEEKKNYFISHDDMLHFYPLDLVEYYEKNIIFSK